MMLLNNTIVLAAGIMLCVLLACQAPSGIDAFPGAEGFGRHVTGGRGGVILFVENLNDDGPGSYRAAAEADGKRIIIFRTGGLITLTRSVNAKPDATIFGQTAPGGGICFRNADLGFDHNTILRGIRIRPGNRFPGPTGAGRDVINVTGNTMVDHCSFSWGSDEGVTHGGEFCAKNRTMQWCIISEGLARAIHEKFEGMGTVHCFGVMYGSTHSFHHNLIAGCSGRTPGVAGAGEFINNVTTASEGLSTGDLNDSAEWNVIANYNSGRLWRGVWDDNPALPIVRLYFKDNLSRLRPDLSEPETKHINPIDWKNMEDEPVTPQSGIRTQDAVSARDLVYAHAGAVSPWRDAVDSRIIAKCKENQWPQNWIIDQPEDVGGWPQYRRGTYPQDSDSDGIPDVWETAKNLNPNDAADAAKVAPNGYMWIEEYANSLIKSPYGEYPDPVFADIPDEDVPDPNAREYKPVEKPAPGVFILDNENAAPYFTMSIAHCHESAQDGKYNESAYYLTDYDNPQGCEATWTPPLINAGTYKVYAWWTAYAERQAVVKRADDAPYVIKHRKGSTTVRVDQNTNGGQWNLLGEFEFAAGTGGSVTLKREPNQWVTTKSFDDWRTVAADAVKFEFQGTNPSPHTAE